MNEAGEFAGVSGCRSPQQEGPGTLSDPHSCSQAEGLLRPQALFKNSRVGGRKGGAGRSPQITEPIADRIFLPAIGTSKLALEDTTVPNVVGQEDETELRTAAGTAQPICQKKMHVALRCSAAVLGPLTRAF